MSRILTAIAMTAVMAGCDGENPFQIKVESPDGTSTEILEPGDPNTDVNNRFAYDPAELLTMNSVEYDDNGTAATGDDMLVINNLPFDGNDGTYVPQETFANGTRVFVNNGTETGLTRTYAVFISSDYMEAAAAASGQWQGYGYAGANINRDSFGLPDGTESYNYVGNYVSTRTFSDTGGIEIVTGDAVLRLDIEDFDLNGDLVGAVDGVITGRERQGAAGAIGLGELPDIVLAVTSFNADTLVWEGGDVTTTGLSGDQRDDGIHDGLIAGPNGEEMGGYLIMTGAADEQRVTYQVIVYQTETFVPTLNPLTGEALTDPATGDPIGTTVTTTETVSGIDNVDTSIYQDLIDARQDLPDYLSAPAIPGGATILSDIDLFIDFITEYEAREVGVFIGDIQ